MSKEINMHRLRRMRTPGPWPIDTCEKCRRIYWACACGDSPINGITHRPEDLGPKPERCNNSYHVAGGIVPMEIHMVDFRHCCENYTHHVGGQCKHCGERD